MSGSLSYDDMYAMIYKKTRVTKNIKIEQPYGKYQNYSNFEHPPVKYRNRSLRSNTPTKNVKNSLRPDTHLDRTNPDFLPPFT